MGHQIKIRLRSMNTYLCSSRCFSISCNVFALNLQNLQVFETSVCWWTVLWKNDGIISNIFNWLFVVDVSIRDPSEDKL